MTTLGAMEKHRVELFGGEILGSGWERIELFHCSMVGLDDPNGLFQL